MEKRFKRLSFPEIVIFTPKIFIDNRGWFFENFNSDLFANQIGVIFEVLQENISYSRKNVLRGLHYQKGKHAQSKLIHVVKGSILDVIVDIRPNSKNFGKWISYFLNGKNNESIFIPAGFAHGFLGLSNFTRISYKVNKLYNKDSEYSILWNDKKLGIEWAINDPILSEKDKMAQTFEENYKKGNFLTI